MEIMEQHGISVPKGRHATNMAEVDKILKDVIGGY